MPGRMDIRFTWGPASDDAAAGNRGEPFAILAVAPWRGDAPAPGPLDARPPRRIDTETFDAVFAAIAPRILVEHCGDGGSAYELKPGSLDELHPDALLRHVPALRSLGSLLSVARDPATFRDAASVSGEVVPAAEDDTATLSRLLGRAPAASAAPEGAASAVDRLIRDAVRPFVVPRADPRQAEVVAGLEAAVGAALRAALRQSAFQTFEARWRSLRRLVFGIDNGGPVRIYALDVGPGEGAADLAAGSGGPPPSLRRAMERAAAKEGLPGWSLIVSDSVFEARVDDVVALRGWAELAAAAGAPFVANAGVSLAGAGAPADLGDPGRWIKPHGAAADAWSELRRGRAAAFVGLALPRVLARAPYGALTDPIDTLPFEEASDDPGAPGFVWSGAAWSCAELIAAAASQEHAAPLEAAGTLDDLPFAIYTAGGGRAIRPCAEEVLPDRAVEALLDAGLIPVAANPSRNELQIPRLQSVAEPPRPLGER